MHEGTGYRAEFFEGFAEMAAVEAKYWKSYVRKMAQSSDMGIASCKLLAFLEAWEYLVFTGQDQICYLAKVNSTLPLLQVSSDKAYVVHINTGDSSLITDQFVAYQSNNQDGFLYYIMGDVLNKEQCSFHCFFHICDFFWFVLQTSNCYLANFMSNGTLSDGSTLAMDTYILKGNCNNQILLVYQRM